METYYIKLKCFETTGYFTGIITTSTGKEVGVHPYKQRAHKFDDKFKAIQIAKQLKFQFKCIISYEIVN